MPPKRWRQVSKFGNVLQLIVPPRFILSLAVAGCCWRLVHPYPQQENEMDTNIDKSPKGGTSPGSPGASRASGDIRSPGLSPDKPALTGSLQDKVGSAVDQARAGIADSASSASADLASDVEKMRADMASMK